MKALLILAIISAALLFIANVWIRISVSYDEKLSVKLKILFLSFTVFPKKKKKIDPKKFSLKKFKKRRIKEEKAYLKKQKASKESKKTSKEDEAKKSTSKKKGVKESASYIMSFIRDVVFKIIKKTAKYLRVDISEFRIVVGGDDAAEIAIEYGVVSQIAGYIIGLIDGLKHTRYTKDAVVEISCDFTAPSSNVSADLSFRLRVWHLVAIAASGIRGYLKV